MTREIGSLRTRLSWEDDGANRGLESMRQDLRGLRSEMNNARSGSREYTQSLRGMREQSDILTRTFRTQQQQVSELRRRYDEARRTKGENARETRRLQTQYNNASAQMRRTEEDLRRLNREIERQSSPLYRAGQDMERYGTQLQTIGRGMTQFGRQWSMRVTAPIVGLGAAALKTGMEFEESMSRVQAISGATGEDFQRLEDLARELGSTTRFSASEAASGMEFLAMAGFETNQVIEAMPGLLDLAAAASMDLGRAADITSNIISGFGYEADEAGRVADVLASGASSANTNVEQLGDAMATVAPVASSLGLDIEDLTAAVGFMSDAGIQGSQAGRMLRQGLLRLSAPTGEAAGLIDELGINVFDADGNMKAMHEVVGELENGLDGMSSQAQTAALTTLFGAQSTAGWTALISEGGDALADYTGDLYDAEGAASEMADTMNDNAAGAMQELKSAWEEASIALAEHMIPAFTEVVENLTDMIRRFGELDDEQQQQIIQWAAILAAVGPVSVALGGLTTTIGGIARVAGTLLQVIGGRAGLTVAFRALTGPVGLTTTALGLVGGAVYNLTRDKEELNEVSTATADKFTDEANSLQPLVDRYNELRNESRLTGDEFLRLLDIETELARTQDPHRIEALKSEYADLKEESGLNNEQLDEMKRLNEELISQTPGVVESYNEKGNAVVENTSAIQDYIDSLHQMAYEDLRQERISALENEKVLLEENKQLIDEMNVIEQARADLAEIREIALHDEEAAYDRLVALREELYEKQAYVNEESAEGIALAEAYEIVNGTTLDTLTEQYETIRNSRDETQEKLNLNEEELQKLHEVNDALVANLLAQADLNGESSEAIDIVNEELARLEEKKNNLIETGKEQGVNNEAIHEGVEYYRNQISELEGVRGEISEILGFTGRHNDELEIGENWLRMMEMGAFDLGRGIDLNTEAQGRTNDRFSDGIDLARDMTTEAEKDVTKNVDVTDNGSINRLNERASSPITKTINLVSSATSAIRGFYAEGTDHHPGGPFIAGEEGYELGRMGNRFEMLDFGMYDRPRGYQVFTHDETKRILSSVNKMPGYAQGVSPAGEARRVEQAVNQGMSGETELHITMINTWPDGREISRETYQTTAEFIERDRKRGREFGN